MNAPLAQPPGSPEKKGMPVIAWVGIGCGTIIVIAIICVSLLVGFCSRKLTEFSKNPEKAGAELMVKMNPNLKVVSQDDSKGEMTIRTNDGQEMTMSYKDVSKGKFTFKDAKGNVTQFGEADLSNVPAWVPRLAGMKSTSNSFQNEQDGKISGVYNATFAESAETLESNFSSEADKLGLTQSSRSAFSADGAETRTLTREGGGKKMTIIITAKAGEDAQVVVAYEETK